ncbi:MAG TPA: sugar phosphate nucleotidyltransferase [Bacteroidota bacterium]|nr:sugar phosphate nucleotidyltransferase [Bacteroidota bacterium]
MNRVDSQRKIAAIIMAAGKGTRMKDPSRAKVMYELQGKPMVHYVVDLAFELQCDRVLVIVGYQRETVTDYVMRSHPTAECIVQAEQLGTGHAVMQTISALREFAGDLLVLSGDVPLLKASTMKRLVDDHRKTGAKATILTAELPDPTGYGRIVRNPDGSVKKIVEHKDASAAELQIREINSGIYVFEKSTLFDGLQHIDAHNAQNEYYLTDVFEYFWKHGWKVSAVKADDANEIRGINTIDQLKEAERVMELRIRKAVF